MAFETFQSVEGIISGINRGDSCCSMMVSLISNSNIVNVIVTGETTVVDNVRLRPGMRIAAFYDANLPTPAIFPPQYRAELVTTLRRNQQVKLDYFDDDLTSSDNSLRLNIGPTTNIVTLKIRNCLSIIRRLPSVFPHRQRLSVLLCCVNIDQLNISIESKRENTCRLDSVLPSIITFYSSIRERRI